MLGPVRMGLPKGNLNKEAENRGCTARLLELAGFKMRGYEPGKEADIPSGKCESIRNNFLGCAIRPAIEFYVMKPKQLIVLLSEGRLDCAIMGRDTVEEYNASLWRMEDEKIIKDLDQRFPLEYYQNPISFLRNLLDASAPDSKKDSEYVKRLAAWEKIKQQIMNPLGPFKLLDISDAADLGYGRVSVCLASQPVAETGMNFEERFNELDFTKKGVQISIASAYPNVTYGELYKSVARRFISIRHSDTYHSSIRDLLHSGIYSDAGNGGVKIYPLSSNTEMMLQLGLADFVVDSVSSGKSMKKHRLDIIGNPLIENSTAHLYLKSGNLLAFSHENKEPNPLEAALSDLVQRLKEASHTYALERKDSIWHPHGRPADA